MADGRNPLFEALGDPEANPLFEAFRDPEATLDLIRSIVAGNPQLVRQLDQGFLPLHEAVSEASPDVVRYLIEQWPESVTYPTDDAGRIHYYPIHLAFGRRRVNPAANQNNNHDEEENVGVGLAADAAEAAEAMLETVRILVEAWPGSLLWGDSDGRAALHFAFINTPSLEVVRFVVERCPDAVRAKDSEGYIPLHYAVSSREDRLPVIQFLVQQYPESVRAKTNTGEFALVRAIKCFAPTGVLKFLLDCWPESAQEPVDAEGRIPLHEAARVDNLPAAKSLAAHWPESVLVRSLDGRLPLHEAARSRDGIVCPFLVGQWPQSVRERSHSGFLPLHEAASAGNVSAARYLVEQWPDSVDTVTDLGWLPLHLAVQCRPFFQESLLQSAFETARFLLELRPRAAWEPTSEGYLPLHVACGLSEIPSIFSEFSVVRRMEHALVHLLVTHDRRLARAPSREGLFPLQYAIRGGFSLPAVDMLGQEWPESLLFWNAEGRSALHLALAREAPYLDLVRWLVEQHPELLGGLDRDGSLPLHSAAASRQPLDVVRYVAEQLPEAVAHRDRRGSLPLHFAAGSAASLDEIDVIEFLVERRPQSVDERDYGGSLPLHRAVARGDSSLGVVQFLVEERPPSVPAPVDGAGMRPLLSAACHDAPLDVLFFLARKHPDTVYERAPRERAADERP